MLSSRFGHVLDKPLRGISLKIKIHPNVFSITGFLITGLSAIVIPVSLFYGGILLCLGSMFDMFDGIIARNRNLVSAFGAFLDSTLDRISDGIIFLSLGFFFYLHGNIKYSFFSVLCLVVAYLVSYTRARIEGLGGECKVGIMERPERLIVIILGLLMSGITDNLDYTKISLWLVFVASLITVIQRVHHGAKVLRNGTGKAVSQKS